MSVETLNILQCNECIDQKDDHTSVMTRFSKLLINVFEALEKGLDRQRSRLQLAKLDDRMLQDVGLNRVDVEQEMDKPFWL